MEKKTIKSIYISEMRCCYYYSLYNADSGRYVVGIATKMSRAKSNKSLERERERKREREGERERERVTTGHYYKIVQRGE